MRDIPGYDGYQVDRNGNVYSKKTEKYLHPNAYGGYNRLNLYQDGKKKLMTVHRLVAMTFVKNPNNDVIVNHIDGDKTNNTVENLEWISQKKNVQHSVDTRLQGKFTKCVVQLDKNNKEINRYSSIQEAAKKTGIKHQNISLVCWNKGKTAGGYKWRFTKEDHSSNHDDSEDSVEIEDYSEYTVDVSGNVYSNKRNRYLKIRSDPRGYRLVQLYKDGKGVNMYLHRLVARHFLDNPNNYPIVNHKDGNKSNNHVSNLEWCTSKENNVHAVKSGLKKTVKIDRIDEDGTVVFFSSLAEAARHHSVHISSIWYACSGRTKTCAGYRWEYAESS